MRPRTISILFTVESIGPASDISLMLEKHWMIRWMNEFYKESSSLTWILPEIELPPEVVLHMESSNHEPSYDIETCPFTTSSHGHGSGMLCLNIQSHLSLGWAEGPLSWLQSRQWLSLTPLCVKGPQKGHPLSRSRWTGDWVSQSSSCLIPTVKTRTFHGRWGMALNYYLSRPFISQQI